MSFQAYRRSDPGLAASILGTAVFAVACLPAWWQDPRPALGLALAFGLLGLLWRPARAALGASPLALGATGLLLLLLKDLWPLSAPWLELPEGNLAADAALQGRNLQAWDGLTQLGAAAAALLGVSTIIAAHHRGVLSRAGWLRAIAGLMLVFCIAHLLRSDLWSVYDEAHHIAGIRSKNAAATLAALAVVLSAGLGRACWRCGRTRAALIWFAAASVASVSLARLHSWTGLAGAVGGIALLVLPAGMRRRRRVLQALWSFILPLGFAIGLVIVNPALGARLMQLPQEYRIQIWHDALPLLRQHPAGGIGLGTYEKTLPLVSRLELPADARLTHPDSSWVLLTVEWGPLAALLLAAGAAMLLRRDDPVRGPASTEEAAYLRANQAAVLAWCVCGLTDISFHRPETLLPGLALLGTLPWPGLPGTRLTTVATAVAGLLVAGGWLARNHAGRDEAGLLRWDPLNPRVQYAAAIAAWNQHGDRPEAIRRFRISTRLDSHSAHFPAAIGRLLAPSAPQEAAWFWKEMLQRCRGDEAYGASLLLEAKHAAPALPAGYWQAVAAEALPDTLLALAAEEGANASELVGLWTALGDPRRLSDPNFSGFLFSALARAPDAGSILARLLPTHADKIPADVQRRSALLLQAAGDSSRAWEILVRLEPITSLPARRAVLLADARFRQWVKLLDEGRAVGNAVGQMKLLDEAIARVGAQDWFRWERARLLRALGREREAVDELLILSSPRI